MRFSIIIPVYNVKDYLEKCVESVLVQDCSDCEILLVDDGSTDGASGEICDRYAQQRSDCIRVIHKPNGGLGDARNVGIEETAGDYVIFLDSDDYLEPTTLTVLREAIDRTNAEIINFGFSTLCGDKIVGKHIDPMPTNRVFTLEEEPRTLLSAPAAPIRAWKRSLLIRTGIRFPKWVWYEDIRTTLKLMAEAKSIVSVPEALYVYFAREGSITRNVNVDRNVEIVEAFEDLLAWFEARGWKEKYHNELCRLVVDHVLIAASVRVLRIDKKHELLGRFAQYTQECFPEYRKNPYLKELPRSHKLILRLLRGKHYSMVRFLFACKDKLGR